MPRLELDEAPPAPQSARRAAVRYNRRAAATFDERMSLTSREHASSSLMSSEASQRRTSTTGAAAMNAHKEAWETQPDFVDALARWSRSMEDADGLLTQRQALLARAESRERQAKEARLKARPRVCDIHGDPFGPQRLCLCSRHERKRGNPVFTLPRGNATRALLNCEHCGWLHEDLLGAIGICEPTSTCT